MDGDDRLRQSYEERVRALNHEIRQRERELVILAEVAGRVHGAEEVQQILDIALDQILSRMELNAAWIFTGDERDRKLSLVASRGVSPAYHAAVPTRGLGEAERRRNRQAQAMAAINRAIGGSLDPEAILGAVGDTAREILSADRVAIFLGSTSGEIRVARLAGLPHPELVEGQVLDLRALG